MKYLSAFIACIVCRAVHAILRLFGKGGTAFPGRIALRICPDVLKITARGVKTLVITGTNGKTTSARMAETALIKAGYSVFSNRSGANLIDGIACEFILNADFLLKPKKPWAVIECDEASCRRVLGELKPAALLVTNLFRDQLDRYGSVKAPRDAIAAGLSACPDTVLCLNADSQLTASVADGLSNRTLYFGFSSGDRQSVGSGEDDRCIYCGKKLRYDFVTYASLGSYRCPGCKNTRKTPQICVEALLSDNGFLLSHDGIKEIGRAALPGTYNVYNAAGVITLCLAAGVDVSCALDAVSDFECGFGRMESFDTGGAGAKMILIKNAAAADQTLDYIKSVKEPKSIVFAVNNRPADGTDISWIYEADFGKLSRMRGLKKVYVTGDRAKEMEKRLDSEKIACEVVDDCDIIQKIISREDSVVFLLPTYTAMLEMRERLVKKLGGKNFWE